MHRNKMLRDAYTYTRKMGQIFAIKYMNVFNAIPHTVETATMSNINTVA